MNNTHSYRAVLLLIALAFCGTARAQMGAALVPPASATDTAKQTGSWQDAATWTDGTVPVNGETVSVPAGITVTNHAATADVRWCHVAGVLTCCDHCDVQFNIDTTFIAMGGAVRLGMPGMPATGKVVYEFPPGPFLPGDTTKLSRGIINHGEFTVCGVEKTASDIVDGDLPVGATSLKLLNVPYGWKVGDRIAIAGTDSPLEGEHYQTEERTVAAVNGRTVTWSEPLLYRHFRWRSDLPFHCANTSRNIVIRSRDTSTIENRGHIMNMAAMNQLYCRIEGCGRTDKSQPVTDPRFDVWGQLVKGSDKNPRARYANHDHKVGPLSPPLFRLGIVIDGSPGWGGLNHASNVIYEDCIALRCFGFGFGTEEGQERGAFRRCISFLNRGRGDTVVSTDGDHGSFGNADFGSDGSGFWLQGGLVEVSDCVSFDNSGRGFGIFNWPFNGYQDFNGVATHLQFPIVHDASLLPEDYKSVNWWLVQNPKPTTIPSGYVPIRVFNRNSAYGNKIGLQGWNAVRATNHAESYLPSSVRGSITDLTLWGRGAKLHLEYHRNINVTGLRLVGDNQWRVDAKNASINRQDEAVLLRGAQVTIRDWEIVGVQHHMREFGVGGANDEGGIPAKNIVIDGMQVNADGTVTKID